MSVIAGLFKTLLLLGKRARCQRQRGVHPYLRMHLVLYGRQQLEIGAVDGAGTEAGSQESTLRSVEVSPNQVFIGLPHAWDRPLRTRYECEALSMYFAADTVHLVHKDYRIHDPRPHGPDDEVVIQPRLVRCITWRCDLCRMSKRAIPLICDIVKTIWQLALNELEDVESKPLDPAMASWLQVRSWIQQHCHESDYPFGCRPGVGV